MKKTTFAIVSAATLFSGGFFYFNNSSAQTALQNQPLHQQGSSIVHPANAPSSGPARPSSLAAQPSTASQPSLPAPPRTDSSGPGNGSGISKPDSADSNNSSAQNQADSSTGGRPAAPRDIAQILQGADLSDPTTRAQVVAQMTRLEESRMEEVLEKAGQLGIPVRIDGPGGKVSILHSFRGDEPIYRTTNNKNAAISTGASLAQAAPYSLDGTGVKVGVWDGGSIRSTHRELNGRVTKKNAAVAVDDHATHVAGTIGGAGTDANAKGMAPKATIDSYDWDNDYAEMTLAGTVVASDLSSITISNHSYGYGASTQDMGRYETEAKNVDALACALPFFLPFWAAGNEQDSLTTYGGYQSVTFNSVAKNILTVGAVNDAVLAGVRAPSAGTMTTFSSWGPCDDGRIKPDVVANGAGLYSSTAGSDSSYDSYSGTSMATPNAAGSAALLQQMYANLFNQRLRASMLKALLIQTADDLGNPGPDYKFGWGLINTKAAADLIQAQKSNPSSPKLLENMLTPTVKSVSTTFVWDGTSPIRATLCWTDPAGTAQTAADSRTPNLVHDLDLKITGPDGSTTYLPFVMPFVGTWTAASMATAAITGKNKTDNVEQVRITAPNRAGSYTITVSMDGALTTAFQSYSLVVTGMSGLGSTTPTPTPTPAPSPTPTPTPPPVNPAPTVALVAPLTGSSFAPGSPVVLSAAASDLTSNGTAGIVSKVEFFNGSTLIGTDTSAPYSISWTPSAIGSYTLLARATDSQGAVGTSTSATITVVAPVVGHVVISQVYAGGGRWWSDYSNDYVELYNSGAAPVSLAGWSLQLTGGTGTKWVVLPLKGTIPSKGFYLVALAGGSYAYDLPAADANGSFDLSPKQGKIALLRTTTPLTVSSPLNLATTADFIGYGMADAWEGSSPALAPERWYALFRLDGSDTNDNYWDFDWDYPAPRNSKSPATLMIKRKK